MESEPDGEARLSRPASFVRGLREVGWLARLGGWMDREHGGDAMSSTNGEHNRGRNGKPAPRSPVVQRAIDEAVREARKRVEERDPLGDNAPGIMPKLLIGLQRSYDPTTREPDHTLLPEDDPERLAYERGELKSLLESERYKKTLQQLDEIDVEDGFNLEDD